MDAQPATIPSLLAIGIDVGGTKTSLVVTDDDDRLIFDHVEATDAGDLGRQVVALARAAAARLALEGHRPAAVGVAVPGLVDSINGTLRLAVNLGAPALRLAEVVEAAVGVPCTVEHDARAAAAWLCECAGGPSRYLAYISVGTGISAGLILDGVLLRGSAGLAGEIGHLTAVPNGAPCPCGLAGCLETVAAGPAIARAARAAVAGGRPSSLRPTASTVDVFAAVAMGDAVAVEVVDEATAHLARAVRALVLNFGVDRVVIGGGVADSGALLLDGLTRHLAVERRTSALVDAALQQVVIEILPPGTRAGARGVAALARARLGVRPTQREGVGSP